MVSPSPTSRLAGAGPGAVGFLMLAVVGVLGWLLFDFAGERSDLTRLAGADGETLEYLVDSGGRLTVAEAAEIGSREPEAYSGAGERGWRSWEKKTFRSVGSGWVIWVRATLRNPGDRPLRGVLENDDFFADRLEAWVADESGWISMRSGEAVPARDKILDGRAVAVPVTVPAGGERVVYVRIADLFSTYARPVWWPEETAFHVAQTRSGLAEGVYLGGLLALLAYNAFLWLRLRLADLGYYVLYLGAMVVFMLVARAQVPALGWALGSPGVEIALASIIAFSGFALVNFARVFLELAERFPRADRWARGWGLVLLAGAVTLPVWPDPPWMVTAAIGVAFTHIGLFALAVACWRAGVWQARFFVLAFGCLFASSLPLVAASVWSTALRDTAMRGAMIGSALEMLLLSLALADRFARTQRALVEETEQRRMIEAAYADELEVEVGERTRELRSANADKDRILAVIGHDLRGPLTGLMRSADDATGEFARDVTRTGRSLLLMIEDLVQWARLRAGTRITATHRASALVAPAAALHHALAEHGGLALVVDVPEETRVETDLVLAQTLVRNLLANALKFARARVVLRAADAGTRGVRFTVGNDGPPLPPAVAARLAAGEDGPLTATGGMGLRLCREICRALDTRLVAETGPDGGTEFSFVLKKPGEPATGSALPDESSLK